MRHKIHFRKLNRTSEHRRAMLRNMAQSLVEHGEVETTLPKAKTIKPYFERLITLAVKARKAAAADDAAASLRARRQLHRLLGDRTLIPAQHREAYELMSDAARSKTTRMVSGRRYRTGEPKGRLAFTGESIIHRLIEKVAPRYEDRPGGYTRLIRLAKRRIGDNSPLAIVQLVGDEEPPTGLTKPRKSARKRRADARYGMAVKLAKARSRRGEGEGAEAKGAKAPVEQQPAQEQTEQASSEQPQE